MARSSTLEGRLFGWLLALALLPTLLVLAVALGMGGRALEVLGTLGPWAEVAESGRTFIEASESAAANDAALAAARDAHTQVLSESLVQATRWSFIGERIGAVAPFVVVAVAVVLAAIALMLSRRLARELARPIQDLVGWSERMAAGEALPEASGRERREVAEVGALRAALRDAATRIAESRRKELEAERLRAWGEMARRVAHEMKNPLTPLRLAAHRLATQRGVDAEVMSVIREETDRLEELASHFAALGRPTGGPASTVDLEEMLGQLLVTDVPPSVHASLRVAPGTSAIHAYYEALLRAFRNLLRNAVEAVEPRGADGMIELTVAPEPRGGVEVVVADNGAGIPDGVGDRIFEPDYTRKPRGTGLGLAVVRQTVAAHGGNVSARARPGGGAEFIVRLPGRPPEVVDSNSGAT